MRLLLAALVLLALPAASASVPLPGLPVTAHADVDDDGVSVSAGAFTPNCFDCPAAGASASAGPGGVTVRACYGSFVYVCLVDEHIPL